MTFAERVLDNQQKYHIIEWRGALVFTLRKTNMENRTFTPAEIIAEAKRAAQGKYSHEPIVFDDGISEMVRFLTETNDFNLFTQTFAQELVNIQREKRTVAIADTDQEEWEI